MTCLVPVLHVCRSERLRMDGAEWRATGCGSRGVSKMSLGIGMGWRRSRFSAKMGEETVTLMARRTDADSLLCRSEPLRSIM